MNSHPSICLSHYYLTSEQPKKKIRKKNCHSAHLQAKIACRSYVGIFTEIASIWIFIQMDESITLDLLSTNKSSPMRLVQPRYIGRLKYRVQLAEESVRD